MAVNLSPVGGAAAQFFDNSGNVLTGGKLLTYLAGTTTPAVTYTTSAGNISQPNPIILNASGRVPGSGEIWLTDNVEYKFVLTDSNDVLIATYDNITGINSTQPASEIPFTGFKGQTGFVEDLADDDGSDWIGFVAAGVNAVARSAQDKMRDIVSVKDFGAVGDGVTDDTAAIQLAVGSGAESNRAIYFPRGTYLITSTIQLASQSTLYGEAPTSYQNSGRATAILTTAATWTSGNLQPMFRCTASGSTQSFIFQDMAFRGHKTDVVFSSLSTADPLTGPHGVDISGVRDGVDFIGCTFRNVNTAIIQMNQTTSNYLDKVTLARVKFFLCYRAIDLPFNTTAGLSLDNCMLYDCVDWVNAADSRVFSNATSYNNSSFSLFDCGIKGGRIHAISNWFEAGNRFFQPSQGVIAESNFLGVAFDAPSPGANKYMVAPRTDCQYVRMVNNKCGSTNRVCAPLTDALAAQITFEFVGNEGMSGSFSQSGGDIASDSLNSLGSYVKLGMNYIGYNNSNSNYNVITQPNAPDFNNPTTIGEILAATPMSNITRSRQQLFYDNDRKLNFRLDVTTAALPIALSDNSNYVKIKMLGDNNGSGGGVTFEAVYEFIKVTADDWQVVASGADTTSWTVTLSNDDNAGTDVLVEQNHSGGASRDKLYFVESSPNITITLNPNP